MAHIYYQCSSCGAPNISSTNCEYCKSVLTHEEKLIHSNIDKSKFDLGIYELREGRTGEAKKIFDSILIKDSNNTLALFYKYIVEISWGNDLNKISKRLADLNFYKIDFSLANDLLESIEHSLSYNGEILPDNFISFIEKLPVDTRILFLETMLKRYSNDLSIQGRILEELKILLSHKELLLLDKNTTTKLINKINEGFNSRLDFIGKIISNQAERNLRKSIRENEPQDENEYLIKYLNEERKYIQFLRTCTFLNEIPEIGFEIYIEKCEKKDEQIRNSGIIKNTEGNKQSEHNKQNKECFIATATMGSYDHPVVKDLRLFRDNWLLKRNWGITFTKWYYTHGPKAARVIERSNLLKMATFILVVKPLQIITKVIRY